MPSTITNKPRIERGAFVEHSARNDRLTLAFQFNPEQLTRRRSVNLSLLKDESDAGSGRSARRRRRGFKNLKQLREEQEIDVMDETISLDIRLDATDRLAEGDAVAAQHGVGPHIATLELMMQPKADPNKPEQRSSRQQQGHSYTQKPKPPMILFVWGRDRVMPAHITSMDITESEFSKDLVPIRATVSVSLSILEGGNDYYIQYQQRQQNLVRQNQDQVPNAAEIIKIPD